MKRVLGLLILLIAYGSLFPFHMEKPAIETSPLWYLLNRWDDLRLNSYVPHDVLVNVVLYLPLGLVGHFAFRRARLLGPVLLAAALSFAIEFAQIWEPGREPSMVDFLANSAGATLGVVAAVFIGWTSLRLPKLSLRVPAAWAWIAVAAFALMRFETHPAGWSWIPFEHLLRGRAETGLVILAMESSACAAVIALLRLSGRAWVTATAIVTAFAAVNASGITEPLVAALTGFVLLSLFPGTETQSRSAE